MQTIYQLVKILAVACIIPVTIFLCLFLWTLRQSTLEITKTVNGLPAQVDARLGKIQTDVSEKIDNAQVSFSSDIHFATNQTDKRLASIQDQTMSKLDTLNANFNNQLTQTNINFNNQMSKTNQSFSDFTQIYEKIPAIVADRLDPYTDCKINDLCLQGQLSDSLFAIRTTSRNISETMLSINHTLPLVESDVTKVADSLAVGVPKIVMNVDEISHNINVITHPHWYDRIISYAGLGIGMYRNLNPVTNLTISGTQLIATHP